MVSSAMLCNCALGSGTLNFLLICVPLSTYSVILFNYFLFIYLSFEIAVLDELNTLETDKCKPGNLMNKGPILICTKHNCREQPVLELEKKN